MDEVWEERFLNLIDIVDRQSCNYMVSRCHGNEYCTNVKLYIDNSDWERCWKCELEFCKKCRNYIIEKEDGFYCKQCLK